MKILIYYRHFPVAMGKFFHWTLLDLGHEVFSVGYYSGPTIPWGDFKYPAYDFPPDYVTPDIDFSLKAVLRNIDFKPDLIIQASDNTFLYGEAPCRNIVIGTDPHVVDYKRFLQYADDYYSMQKFYLEGYPFGRWLPYGYYPPIHNFQEREIIYDVVFSGLQYEHRKEVLEEVKKRGFRVLNVLGLIYEEYNKAYNQGLIAFNYSSRSDLPARFWEGLAMKRCVVTNRVPDLKEFDIKEGEHYVGFEGKDEAVEKLVYYSTHPEEAKKIAEKGYNWVKPHTYHKRCKIFL
jgi:hypothetical protein